MSCTELLSYRKGVGMKRQVTNCLKMSFMGNMKEIA